MGMIRSSITVVEPDAAAPDNNRDAPDSYDGYTNGYDTDYGFDIAPDALADPIPANIAIPTDALAVAEFGTGDVQGEEYDIQRISIDLTDDGYSPAIVVVQGGTDAEWTINNTSTADSNYTMLVPFYNTRLDLLPGENPLYLFPTEYFTFSNGDNTFYGYVKVVDNLNEIDKAAIKAEVAAYETLIYPPEVFEGGGGAPSCH
jgi:hypothetical protein